MRMVMGPVLAVLIAMPVPLASAAEVSACTDAAIGYVTQARAHSGPMENVPRRIQIAVQAQGTTRTIVHPLTQGH